MSYSRIARRLGTVQVFTMSGTSQASAAFGGQTRAIRLATSTQPAYFVIGSSPTAAATDNLMPAGWVEDVIVNPGEKIAVLQAGTAGSISVTELT
jgi:hypothetical protein